MAKPVRNNVEDIYVQAELEAAQGLGIKLTSDYVLGVRTKLKVKSHQVKGAVQYYALQDDDVWSDQEVDDRIFAAVRLMYEYHHNKSRHLDRQTRIEKLGALILRLAAQKQVDLPIVHRIKAGEFSLESDPLLED